LAECLVWINEENVLLGVDLVWQKVSLREFSQGPSLRDGKTPGRSTARTQSANEYDYKRTLCISAGVRPLGPENGPIVVPARRRLRN